MSSRKRIVRRITDERTAGLSALPDKAVKSSFLSVKITRSGKNCFFSLSQEERKQAMTLLRRISENSYEAAYEKGDKKWKGFPGKVSNR
jgi:hypothetical protein